MAQKLLNAAMLFKDHVYNNTVVMGGVGDVLQLISNIMTIVVNAISINIILKLGK